MAQRRQYIVYQDQDKLSTNGQYTGARTGAGAPDVLEPDANKDGFDKYRSPNTNHLGTILNDFGDRNPPIPEGSLEERVRTLERIIFEIGVGLINKKAKVDTIPLMNDAGTMLNPNIYISGGGAGITRASQMVGDFWDSDLTIGSRRSIVLPASGMLGSSTTISSSQISQQFSNPLMGVGHKVVLEAGLDGGYLHMYTSDNLALSIGASSGGPSINLHDSQSTSFCNICKTNGTMGITVSTDEGDESTLRYDGLSINSTECWDTENNKFKPAVIPSSATGGITRASQMTGEFWDSDLVVGVDKSIHFTSNPEFSDKHDTILSAYEIRHTSVANDGSASTSFLVNGDSGSCRVNIESGSEEQKKYSSICITSEYDNCKIDLGEHSSSDTNIRLENSPMFSAITVSNEEADCVCAMSADSEEMFSGFGVMVRSTENTSVLAPHGLTIDSTDCWDVDNSEFNSSVIPISATGGITKASQMVGDFWDSDLTITNRKSIILPPDGAIGSETIISSSQISQAYSNPMQSSKAGGFTLSTGPFGGELTMDVADSQVISISTGIDPISNKPTCNIHMGEEDSSLQLSSNSNGSTIIVENSDLSSCAIGKFDNVMGISIINEEGVESKLHCNGITIHSTECWDNDTQKFNDSVIPISATGGITKASQMVGDFWDSDLSIPPSKSIVMNGDEEYASSVSINSDGISCISYEDRDESKIKNKSSLSGILEFSSERKDDDSEEFVDNNEGCTLSCANLSFCAVRNSIQRMSEFSSDRLGVGYENEGSVDEDRSSAEITPFGFFIDHSGNTYTLTVTPQYLNWTYNTQELWDTSQNKFYESVIPDSAKGIKKSSQMTGDFWDSNLSIPPERSIMISYHDPDINTYISTLLSYNGVFLQKNEPRGETFIDLSFPVDPLNNNYLYIHGVDGRTGIGNNFLSLASNNSSSQITIDGSNIWDTSTQKINRDVYSSITKASEMVNDFWDEDIVIPPRYSLFFGVKGSSVEPYINISSVGLHFYSKNFLGNPSEGFVGTSGDPISGVTARGFHVTCSDYLSHASSIFSYDELTVGDGACIESGYSLYPIRLTTKMPNDSITRSHITMNSLDENGFKFSPIISGSFFDQTDGKISGNYLPGTALRTAFEYEFNDEDGTAVLLNDILDGEDIPETVLNEENDRLYKVVRK